MLKLTLTFSRKRGTYSKMSSQPSSTAQLQSQAQPQNTSSSSTRPPVTLGQTTHLDPGAYVRGTHAITLGEQILVHPRAQLVAVNGPLTISDKCIISEKCIIGGPTASASSTTPNTATGVANPDLTPSSKPSPVIPQAEGDDDEDPVKTTIGENVYIHASAHVHAGTTIKEAVLIESHVTVLKGVTVGAHSKICAGVTVDTDVDEWTVVMGSGEVRRRRRPAAIDEEGVDVVETMRLKAMDKEREGTVAILKMAARMATLARKK